MKVVISQPRFLPSNNYMERFNFSDCFVYLDTAKFSPRDWENRNRIHNGRNYIWLTVPVKKESKNKSIKETEIEHSSAWKRKVLASIQLTFGKYPYFDEIYPILEKELNQSGSFLIDLNLSLIDQINNLLGFSTRLVVASDLKLTENLKGNEQLIEICQNIGCTEYISGIHGMNYIDEAIWSKAGIPVSYQDYVPANYYQRNSPENFIPWLSIIDTLFSLGAKETKKNIIGKSNFITKK